MPDADTPETFRLFVAIRVPEEVKATIEKTQAKLRWVLPNQSVRWTNPDQLHLTLKFLGSVEAQRVIALTEALRAACQGFAPLELSAAGMGCFPNLHRPRVVWVGVTDAAEKLALVQRAIETATRDYTEKAANERFTGHITLGRIQNLRVQGTQDLIEVATDLATRSFGAWTAAKVELFRSQLSPQGARHTTLAAIPLPA
jgi:2'-5' RNA ligase